MENIEVKKQIENFEARVEFLKKWRDSIANKQDGLTFEEEDKVYKLSIEIESKEALISMRKRDIERVEQEKQQEVNEVKANYAMLINSMSGVDISEPQVKSLIDGIVKRSANPELSIEEMTRDYKIMRSILASIPNKKNADPKEEPGLKVLDK